MRQITEREASRLIKSTAGRFFSCKFVKRTNGDIRSMWCRFAEVGELKGSGRRTTDDLIVVWDDHKQAWRSIPVEGLLELRIDGEDLEVTHNTQELPFLTA
jgi:hypothetical protein